MRNIKLTIEYDGTNYFGWQRQAHGRTVQEEIEKALHNITGENIVLSGSGRTDSGVHALGQVANFKTNSNIDPDKLHMGLNSILPDDISIKELCETEPEFHAQFSSVSKIYIYKIYNNPHRSALMRKRTWFVPYALNISEMIKSAELLIGEHDFRAFAQSDAGVKTTVRKVLSVSILEVDKNLIVFSIEATGFLKRMVRLIVGTLVQVGKGRINNMDFKEILDKGQKTKYVYAAPPQGLYLKEVKY